MTRLAHQHGRQKWLQLGHTSIAPLLLLSASTFSLTALAQSEQLQLKLPELGNSAEDDRQMLREISDSHVHGQPIDAPASQKVLPVKPNSKPASESKIAAALANEQSNDDVIAKDSANAAATAVKTPNNIAEITPTPASAENPDALAAAAELANSELHTERSKAINDPNASVWDVIRASNRLPLKQTERVQFYTEQYEREAKWISKILVRGQPFLAHLVQSLDNRFMPVELALLPAIESGFITDAKSSGNAAGLWQIVPITAREIGIERNEWFDGRRDIIISTRAAIDYLSYLNAEFNGDWELTLAAYNAGPGRVRAAVRKNKKANLPTDFWSLDLPQETKNYLPKMIALIKLIKNSAAIGLDIPKVSMEQAFESINIGHRFSLDKAAELANIDKNLLQSLNAGLIYGITGPKGPHNLLIPVGTGDRFQEAFANVNKQTLFYEPRTHEVASGDTISSIALQYGTSQREIMRINNLDNTRIRIGQKLAVLDAKNMSNTQVEYEVAIGDTLSDIAQRFSVSLADISSDDGKPLDPSLIHPGDKLKISLKDGESG